MLKRKSFIMALFINCLALGSAFGSGNPTYYKGELIHTNQPFIRVGGDEVKFGYAQTGCDTTSLKNAAIALKNRQTTDRWDNLLYAFSVDSGMCIMIGWYDLTSHQYGWAAAQNQPNTWSVSDIDKGWQNTPNGTNRRYAFAINGQKINLELYNPQNEGALTGNDILISFGY